MEKIFNLKNYKIASLIFAFLFFFGGVFKVNDITKLALEPYPTPHKVAIVFGALFLIIFIFLFLEIGPDTFNLSTVKISKDENGNLCTMIGNTKLVIHFKKIEEIINKQDDADAVVVLPANEYFDDECISDRKSVLGAYVDKHFRNRLQEFQEIVRNKLNASNKIKTLQWKQTDSKDKQNSYGIGASVFLHHPLNSNKRVILISVTEQRRGIGLYSNIGFVFKAVDEIYKVLCDNRIDNIYLPLLGSGHGGLKKRVSLLVLITAFSEILTKKNCSMLNSLNIVIYKDANRQDIPKNIVRRILKIGIGLATSKETIEKT